MKFLIISADFTKSRNAVMKGFPKAARNHMNSFLKAAKVENFCMIFPTACCSFWKPVHVATGGFQKPFRGSVSDFQNYFQLIGFELQNTSGFGKISKRCHRSAKEKFNYLKGKLEQI